MEGGNASASLDVGRTGRPSSDNPNVMYLATRNQGVIADLTEAGSRVFDAVGGAYGFILLDVSIPRAWHRVHGIQSNVLHERENAEVRAWAERPTQIRSQVRGAFLVNYLTPEHLAALRGAFRLGQSDAVAEVTKTSAGVRVRLDWHPGEGARKLESVLESFRKELSPILIKQEVARSAPAPAD
jgi:hypothetical protein